MCETKYLGNFTRGIIYITNEGRHNIIKSNKWRYKKIKLVSPDVKISLNM